TPGGFSSEIRVGAGGTSLDFATYPAIVRGWFTLGHPGGNGDIVDDAGLDAAVQNSSVTAINQQVGESSTVSPSISSSSIARWNSALNVIETVASGPSYISLLARLRNTSGTDQSTLTLTYDFNELHAVDTTVVEEVPGHRVYYSFTGDAASWQLIPELSSVGTPGTLGATRHLVSWPNGSLLYVLWADDNANANRSNSNDEEGGYTLDNVTFSFGTLNGVRITA